MEIKNLKRKSAVVAPSLFTMGNMACGFLSLLYASHQELSIASWLILAAIGMDMLDGRIARLVHGESRFGIEFDSMADWISFGIAPSFLIYRFILIAHGPWGFPLAFLFALCGALRLARFNLLAQSGTPNGPIFVGLPIPAAGGLLASFVLVYDIIEKDRPARTLKILMDQVPFLYTLVPLAVLLLSVLMISRIPYAAFKQRHIFRPPSLKSLLAALGGASLVYAYPQNALFIFFGLYVVSGPAGYLWQAYRKRNTAEPQPKNTHYFPS